MSKPPHTFKEPICTPYAVQQRRNVWLGENPQLSTLYTSVYEMAVQSGAGCIYTITLPHSFKTVYTVFLHAEIWVVSHHINSISSHIYNMFHYSVLQYLINVFPSSAPLTVLTPQTIASGFFCASLREWRTKGRLISCPTDLVTPGSGTAVTSKFRNKSLSLISVSFY